MMSLTLEQQALWNRIDSFEFDTPDGQRPFTRRLADEQRWPAGYAVRVVAEYRRFTFLAMVAGHAVSPSEAVDEVWHLHLLYSRSYWEEFCPTVLGRKFHHEPSKGGSDDMTKHVDWYAKTLASYSAFFGETPPDDIWPNAADHARAIAHSRHIHADANKVWILPKPGFLRERNSPRLKTTAEATTNQSMPVRVGSALLMIVGLTGCTTSIQSPLDYTGPDFLVFFSILCASAIIGLLVFQFSMRSPGGLPPEQPNLSPDEIAFLAGFEARYVQTQVARLMRDGVLVIDPKRKVLAADTANKPDRKLEPHDRALVNYFKTSFKIRDAHFVVKPQLEAIRARLCDLGLMVSGVSIVFGRLVTAGVLGAVMALGGIKVIVGLNRHKPFGYLIIMLLVMAVITIAMLIRLGRDTRTRRGDAVLETLQSTKNHYRKSLPKSVDTEDYVLALALFGPVILRSSEQASIERFLLPAEQSYNGSSGSGGSSCSGGGGSSCSGSSCGGGGCGG
ncbi:MAG: TIGR04222 domain-containing membrane protein, partial [Planctomycetota bacterium]